MEARLLRIMSAAAILAALVLLAAPAAAQGAGESDAPAYMNHAVGGKDGWFFDAKTNTSSGNYSDWANGETFYLGDNLIFNTNSNSSVVQSTNSTTYSLCDASEDDSQDTLIYGGGTEEAKTVAVPLLVEGTNYFFSEADGGAQCQAGMRFEIKVLHGQGLPPLLKHPPPPPMEHVLAPPPAGTAFSGTGTVEPGSGAGGDIADVGSVGVPRAAAARFSGMVLGAAFAALLAV